MKQGDGQPKVTWAECIIAADLRVSQARAERDAWLYVARRQGAAWKDLAHLVGVTPVTVRRWVGPLTDEELTGFMPPFSLDRQYVAPPHEDPGGR